MSLGYMFYDDETANRRQMICELAYVLTDFDGNQVSEPVIARIDPEDLFDAWNTRVHHITTDDVVGTPTMEEFCNESSFLQDLGNYTLVAHNAKGADLHHIRKSLLRYGINMPEVEFLDTRTMADALLDVRSLQDVCRHYGIDLDNHHSALADALACKEIFFRMRAEGVDIAPELADSASGGSRARKKTVPISGQGRFNRSTTTIDEVLSELEAEGLRPDLESVSNLSGLVVVVSGTVPGYTENSIRVELTNCNAKPRRGDVSGRANLLAIGHNASLKRVEQAREKHVPVISAGELLELIDAN